MYVSHIINDMSPFMCPYMEKSSFPPRVQQCAPDQVAQVVMQVIKQQGSVFGPHI